MSVEELIAKRAGGQKLEKLKKLDLSGSKLTKLSASPLQKLTSLEWLDISNNSIEKFPEEYRSNKLVYLDISGNKLSSYDLVFLKNFPKLKEVNMEENANLEVSDRYLAALKFEQLEKIGKSSRESMLRVIDHYRTKLKPQVISTWEECFSHKYSDWEFQDAQIRSITDNLTEKVKTRKPFGTPNMVKLRDYLIYELATDLVKSVNNGTYEPPAKKKKITVQRPTLKKKRQNKTAGLSNKADQREAVDLLPEAADFNPVNFVRCHFNDKEEKELCKENDPKDEYTKVWACKFEPDLNDPNEVTRVVATCGGDCVCFIDSGTGSVLKRYKKEKEQFYALAWTTLTMTGEDDRTWKTNILAVGCTQGKLKLIHPGQGVCYAEWGKNKPNRRMTGAFYVSVLTFHPNKPTHLFVGSSDASVTLWDIGVPSGKNLECTPTQQLMYFTPDVNDPIVSLEFSSKTNHIIAGCKYGCYAWKVSDSDFQTGSQQKRRDNPTEICLPGPDDEPTVDTMVKITDDIIATKCVGEGCIYLWSIGKTLGGRKAVGKVKAESLMCLQWAPIATEYLALGYRNGLLGCGDNMGNVYLYNIGELIEHLHKHPYTEVLKPSRIIEWPECQITSQRSQEQQMTDVLEPPEPLVVNAVAFGKDHEQMVCVTDCNLVCLWKQESGATPMEF